MTSAASTRPNAARSETSSHSATAVIRSAISRSISSSGSSGPANAKQSSLSWAIAHQTVRRAAAPAPAPGRARSARRRSIMRSTTASASSIETTGRAPRAGNGVSLTIPTMSGSSTCSAGFTDRGAKNLKLGIAGSFEAFDHDQIDRRKLLQQFVERRLGRATQLMHQRIAVRGRDQHLGRAGRAVGVGILAGLVEIKRMVRVLERRDREPARHDAREHLGEQRSSCPRRSSRRDR